MNTVFLASHIHEAPKSLQSLSGQLRHHVLHHPDFPCLGAKSLFRTQSPRLALAEYTHRDSPESLWTMLQSYISFCELDPFPDPFPFTSFVLFLPPTATTRDVMQLLHDFRQFDRAHFPTAPGITDDVLDTNYNLSFAGKHSFFVPHLHPEATVSARTTPTGLNFLVFNHLEMFQSLRRLGTFDRIRDQIRAAQTEVHPFLSDHGGEYSAFLQTFLPALDAASLEAFATTVQEVEGTKCPFHRWIKRFSV